MPLLLLQPKDFAKTCAELATHMYDAQKSDMYEAQNPYGWISASKQTSMPCPLEISLAKCFNVATCEREVRRRAIHNLSSSVLPLSRYLSVSSSQSTNEGATTMMPKSDMYDGQKSKIPTGGFRQAGETNFDATSSRNIPGKMRQRGDMPKRGATTCNSQSSFICSIPLSISLSLRLNPRMKEQQP
jgi:hypothetical protein